jgi:hypothetical protein
VSWLTKKRPLGAVFFGISPKNIGRIFCLLEQYRGGVMIRNVLFGLGAIFIISWVVVTMKHITLEQPILHILLGIGVALIAIGCLLHMKVSERIGEIEEHKHRHKGREHFR